MLNLDERAWTIRDTARLAGLPHATVRQWVDRSPAMLGIEPLPPALARRGIPRLLTHRRTLCIMTAGALVRLGFQAAPAFRAAMMWTDGIGGCAVDPDGTWLIVEGEWTGETFRADAGGLRIVNDEHELIAAVLGAPGAVASVPLTAIRRRLESAAASGLLPDDDYQ